MCFDYFFDANELKWVHWSTKIQAYIPTDETIFNKIYVATVHTTRLRFLLDIHLKRRKPILFVGSAGTGKTAVIKDYLMTTKPD
jgi:dynein heavy chain